MEKERIVLVGSGQHANVVLYNLKEQNRFEVACILDSNPKKIGLKINDLTIVDNYNNLEYVKTKYKTNKFFIAFGDMKCRKKVYEKFINEGWESVNIIHPNAIVSKNAKLGNGILVECGCLITPNPVIGDNVVINTGSQINHDNIIESHVYIASGVILSGGVTIGENSLIDDSVTVTLGKKIGKNCLIGAGAVVTKNIGDNFVAYGNPCKVIRENNI